MVTHFVIIFSVIALSMAAGYACRRLNLLPAEKVATWLMTAVVVFGYSSIGLLTIWGVHLEASHIWLPALGAVQMALLAALAAPIARKLTKDRGQVGVFVINSAVANSGLTMGGFVVYLLYGTTGLGLANVYCTMFAPMVVLLAYPIARHYASDGPPVPLGRLMIRNLLDWRSIALPLSLAGVVLSPSVLNVHRPKLVEDWRVIDILMYWINISAYFAIGLRLKLSQVRALWKMILALAGTRFGLGLATAVGLWAITLLTPWPMRGVAMSVFLIESFPSAAVTCVALANMFNLRPEDASVLFVANTLMYLLIVMPLVVWFFGGVLG